MRKYIKKIFLPFNPIFELKLKLLYVKYLRVINNYDCFYGKDWCKFNTSWT